MKEVKEEFAFSTPIVTLKCCSRSYLTLVSKFESRARDMNVILQEITHRKKIGIPNEPIITKNKMYIVDQKKNV